MIGNYEYRFGENLCLYALCLILIPTIIDRYLVNPLIIDLLSNNLRQQNILFITSFIAVERKSPQVLLVGNLGFPVTWNHHAEQHQALE